MDASIGAGSIQLRWREGTAVILACRGNLFGALRRSAVVTLLAVSTGKVKPLCFGRAVARSFG